MDDKEMFLFETYQEKSSHKVFVLIIYDIIDNRKRVKLAKYLQGYGFRIQKSAFEAFLEDKVFQKMLAGLKKFATGEDSIRVYKMIGKGQIINFGTERENSQDDVIIV